MYVNLNTFICLKTVVNFLSVNFNNLFKVDCEATYPNLINHSRPLIPDDNYLILWMRFYKRKKPDLSLYAERQAMIYLVPFYEVFGMPWSGIEPTTSRLRGERSITMPSLWLISKNNAFSSVNVVNIFKYNERCTSILKGYVT